MNIGVVLPELGGFSSLSLEFLKWNQVMTDLGHNIFIITGKSRLITNNVTVMADLYPENQFNLDFSSKVFDLTENDHQEIKAFESLSFRIESILSNWVESNQLDVIIIENYFSIPTNLPVTYALFILFQKITCKKIIKHHDAFYKNNIEFVAKNNFIKKMLLACFPIDGENIFHISSNRLIKSYLKEKCYIDSVIIPYVINFSEKLIPDDMSMLPFNSDFEFKFTDKTLINFSDLLPSSKFDQMFQLLKKINDDSFKVVTVVKEHKDYLDYYSYLNERIDSLNLSSRMLILREDEILHNDSFNIDLLFSYAKGVLSFDEGVGFGQPLHLAIQNKCPLLFCTQSHLDWLELSDIGCKLISISKMLNDQDVVSINRYINLDLDWGEKNYQLMKQYYSMNFLQYLLNNILMRV